MESLKSADNVVLIGMPAAGKSTIGVILAKALSLDFVDTDVVIQAREERTLQQLLEDLDPDGFRKLERRHILSLDCRGTVIATGGSVVYSDDAMSHLSSRGVIVHLDLPLEEIERRIDNLEVRGVVMDPAETLSQLFEERQPLYERYAEVTVQCFGLGHEEIVREIVERL
ncbi:MAG: shikimate kinase [Candidatus Brocadiia bacterium]